MKTLAELRRERESAIKALNDFLAKCKDDDGKTRDLTVDELKQVKTLTEAVKEIDSQIVARTAVDDIMGAGANDATGNRNTLPAEPTRTREADPNRFQTFGHQLQAIAQAGINRGTGPVDQRLVWERAGGTGLNEGVPSEGGFLVQTDFSTMFMELMHDQGQVMARVRRIPLGPNSNGIKLPMVDETSRAAGSRYGGVRAYWVDEADTVTESKPKFRNIELRLNKLMSIGYATDELLADAGALEAVMMTAFVEEITFEIEEAILSGTGSGQPLGILNSGAIVSIDKESGQAGSTIVTNNILKMAARLPIRSMRNAVWLINQDTLPQLWALTLGSGTAVSLLYRPAGVEGVDMNVPYGTLLGRPVIPIEQAATLGTVGDIMLVDLNSYVMADKGGIDRATSMHVRFLYEEQTFRLSYRVDGQPTWRAALTPANGTATLSPYIALATRS